MSSNRKIIVNISSSGLSPKKETALIKQISEKVNNIITLSNCKSRDKKNIKVGTAKKRVVAKANIKVGTAKKRVVAKANKSPLTIHAGFPVGGGKYRTYISVRNPNITSMTQRGRAFTPKFFKSWNKTPTDKEIKKFYSDEITKLMETGNYSTIKLDGL